MGQNWSKKKVQGCGSYLTKYGLTISHGDPDQAPKTVCVEPIPLRGLIGQAKSPGKIHPRAWAGPTPKKRASIGDGGEVRFEGEVLKPENMLSLRHRMGYVIQDGGLFPHLTAAENVALLARDLGWGEAKAEARLQELVALTHFPQDGLDRYPVQLSGGQRQRVGLMRALMLDPDLLLLDEPLGALDPMVRAELQRELRQIFRALGKGVVLVTHDMGEAAYFGDEIVLMRSGRIVQQGAFADFVERPAEPFVTKFVNAQRSPLEEGRGT